jgi:GAF domain-containing protein
MAMADVMTLADVTEALETCLTREAVFEILGEAVRRLVGSDGTTIVLREGNFCHYVDENAIGPLWKDRKFPVEKCISGWAMLHSVPVTIADIYVDPRIPWDAYRPTFVKSLAMAPILQGHAIGALGAYWAEKRHPTDAEIGTLRALADLASRALAATPAGTG